MGGGQIASLLAISTGLSPLLSFAAIERVYDVNDYVQNGLVAHFDARRNVGVGKAHDSSVSTWDNLVPNYPNATISQGAGAWAEDGSGYVFNGTKATEAQLDSKLVALGMNATIQLVTTIDTSIKSVGNYYGYFHPGDNDQMAIFSYKKSGSTVCFNNKYALKGGRPEVSWDGRYLTALITGESISLFTDTAVENTAVRTIFNQIPANRWCWGGSSYNENYSFTGTYHNVRVYTRALTQDELIWNRMIDEQRYRTEGYTDKLAAVNVILESNMKLGDCVTGYIGQYVVDGTEVFAAPASVMINGNEWEPTGYKLETWNVTDKKWDVTGEIAETSYSYTSGEDVAKVRITWNWRLKNGVKKYDADDYVQAGLHVNFDGIRNAGLGMPHDSFAQKWVNLGSADNATLINFDDSRAGGEWKHNGYWFNGGEMFSTGDDITIGYQMTAQVIADYVPSIQVHKYPAFFGSDNSTDNDILTIFARNTGNKSHPNYYKRGDLLQFIAAQKYRGSKTSRELNGTTFECEGIAYWGGRFVNVGYDYGKGYVTESTNISWGDLNSDNKNPIGANDRKYSVGSVMRSTAARKERGLVGRIYAARAYDRILTETELKHNREVDLVRFFETAGASTETDLVEVLSESPGGIVKVEMEGAYIVRGTGSLELTAPTSVSVGHCTYTCIGYRTETWNAELRAWESPVKAEGVTVAISGTNGAGNRRITWLWKLESGIRTATDYDVGDYVQQGLVAHYDAIRNCGVDSEHTQEGVWWRDLSYRCNDLLAASNLVESSYTSWSEKAYQFLISRYSPMRMTDTLTLGKHCSIQAVMTVDHSQQSVRYPTYFGASNDNGCFGKNGELNWKTDGNNNFDRPAHLTTWEGRYITAIANGGGLMYLTQGTKLESTVTDTKNAGFGSEKWSVGGSAYTDSGLNKRVMTGDYHAARFYNRALTEEELAHNRKVDEIRYRGNFANYANLTVANVQPEGLEEGDAVSSSVADGLYELVGSIDMTAAIKVVNEKKLRPKYKLETKINGEWVETAAAYAESCTLTAGENPQRITWSWGVRGFSVVVR